MVIRFTNVDFHDVGGYLADRQAIEIRGAMPVQVVGRADADRDVVVPGVDAIVLCDADADDAVDRLAGGQGVVV